MKYQVARGAQGVSEDFGYNTLHSLCPKTLAIARILSIALINRYDTLPPNVSELPKSDVTDLMTRQHLPHSWALILFSTKGTFAQIVELHVSPV